LIRLSDLGDGLVRVCRCLLLAVLVGCSPRPGLDGMSAASDMLSRGAVCDSCAIEMQPVTTLVAGSDSILPDESSSLVVDSRGSFYATSSDHNSIIQYAPDGRTVSFFGRTGDGPGELRDVVALHEGIGDTLFVTRADGLVLLFDGARKFVRSARLRSGCSPLKTLPHFLCVGRWRTDKQSEGVAFHVVRRDGELVRSFGNRDSSEMANPNMCPMCLSRIALEGALGRFWAVDMPGLKLEDWSLDGSLVSSLVFEPTVTVRGTSKGKTPITSTTVGAEIGSDGILWVSSIIRGEDPSRSQVQAPVRENEVRRRLGEILATSIGLVEAVRPGVGVVSALLAGSEIYRTTGAGLLWSTRYDADGILRIDIWKPILREHR
jgi:hypothetical protein